MADQANVDHAALEQVRSAMRRGSPFIVLRLVKGRYRVTPLQLLLPLIDEREKAS